MSERHVPKLGEITPTGYTCTRETATYFGESFCGEPAVLHIAWDVTIENSLACYKHATEALTKWEPYDWHEVAHACADPKTWISSGIQGDSYCADDNVHPDLAAMAALDLSSEVAGQINA